MGRFGSTAGGKLVGIVLKGIGHPSLPLLALCYIEAVDIAGLPALRMRLRNGEAESLTIKSPDDSDDDGVVVLDLVRGSVASVLILPSDNLSSSPRMDAQGKLDLGEVAKRFSRIHGIRNAQTGEIVPVPWVLVHGLPSYGSSETTE